MPIDYEAEYNNRARVPEHPEIFVRWERDAAAYRAEAQAEGRAELGLRFGPSERQIIDLFCPAGGSAGPVALFVHGGWWRSLSPGMFSHLARGLNERGIVVAMSGYDLCPQVTVAEIIDQTRRACVYLWRRFGRRLMVSGHSAGGHLAACMLATDWKTQAGDLPPDLVPAAYAISGLFDLTPLLQVSTNADLRLTEDEARKVSPVFWPAPAGLTLDAMCGGAESSEFLRQNRVIAEAWGKGGAIVQATEAPGANHFTVLDPMTDTGSPMVARMAALCERTQAVAA